jgi:predicted AAA+ superfamily ATPase
MRRFSSYGPVNTKLHYYAPRKELIEKAYTQLIGHNPGRGGHYFTVWAPRQAGKTWIMQQILHQLQKEPRFDVLKINLEHLKYEKDTGKITEIIAMEIGEGINRDLTGINTQDKFQEIFKKGVLEKPLMLILDKFDALSKEGINNIVSVFRNIYIKRTDEVDKPKEQKSYLLHGVALIGVRSVLGIENKTDSPFNIQRSMNIPNLTFDEVKSMFQWYEKESGQSVEPEVVKKLYDETRGQPGLVSWLGELLTEGFSDYTVDLTRPIGMKDFNIVYTAATVALPNNNILNLISKAKKEANKIFLLEMFNTGEKLEFTFDDPTINDLYMNGLVDRELDPDGRYYLRFSSPLAQKRIFNYFSYTYFRQMGQLAPPFTSLDNVITDTDIYIPNLLKLYQTYLKKNSRWLFKSVPRRTDTRIYEAVYHFNLFSYLDSFLKNQGGRVFPEFPTGNGKIDLIVAYEKKRYGIELKSFTNEREYKKALRRAAQYGKQLGLTEIYLVSFLESIDEESRKKYEVQYLDEETGVNVVPIFLVTG